MASTIKNVVLIGGSGNLGSFLIKALLKHNFNLTVLSRHSSKATFNPLIKIIRVDDAYPEDELVPIFQGQDAVVVSISHASKSAQNGMVDAAVKAGVKRFIPSEYSSIAENERAIELDPRKKDTERDVAYLRSKESTGLTWTAMVNGLFFDMILKHGYGSINLPPDAIGPREFEIWDSGTSPFSWSTSATIAEGVALVLKHPERTANQYIYISTFETTQLELLQVFKAVTNTEDKYWKISYVNSEDKIKQGKEWLKEGKMMMGLMNIVFGFAFSGEFGADFREGGRLANELLGLEQVDVKEVVRRFRDGESE